MTPSPRTSSTPSRRPGSPAVVVGVDNITGLQTARLLADRGVPVVGVASSLKHWGARTRSCVEILESPLADTRLLETLHDVADRWAGPGVLFPCTDLSVAFLSRHRDQLPEGLRLPLACHDTVDLLMDKSSFATYAAGRGLPVPRAATIHDAGEAEDAAASFEFPCVLKPGLKSAAWLGHTKAKGFVVHSREHFLSLYEEISTWAPEILLQEWVDGAETDQYTCNAYFDEHGDPLVTFMTRKVRQWPPRVGTGSSGEECRNDDVLKTTIDVFGGLGFHGLAYLEMKQDVSTGRLMIIEPNVGRPTGRSATAEAGGVELVYTAYRHALGLPLPEARTQRYGDAKWIDLRRDAQAALVASRQGTLPLREWARWLRGPKAHAIWSSRDPLPFATDLAQATFAGGRMLARHLSGRNPHTTPAGGNGAKTPTDDPTPARPGPAVESRHP